MIRKYLSEKPYVGPGPACPCCRIADRKACTQQLYWCQNSNSLRCLHRPDKLATVMTRFLHTRNNEKQRKTATRYALRNDGFRLEDNLDLLQQPPLKFPPPPSPSLISLVSLSYGYVCFSMLHPRIYIRFFVDRGGWNLYADSKQKWKQKIDSVTRKTLSTIWWICV